MLLKFLGMMDILSGIALFFTHLGVIKYLMLLFIIYLIIKGLIFLPDVASIIDIIVGLYSILVLLGLNVKLTFVIIFYLILKGLFCFIEIS